MLLRNICLLDWFNLLNYPDFIRYISYVILPQTATFETAGSIINNEFLVEVPNTPFLTDKKNALMVF